MSRPVFGGDGGNKERAKASTVQFNPVYAGICGGYAALMLLQNPYIFAGLTILTIIPQNSSTTSLNSLVLIFYDSGLFMNFAGESAPCAMQDASPVPNSPHAPCMHAHAMPNSLHMPCLHAHARNRSYGALTLNP